jgi:hypothetical protein
MSMSTLPTTRTTGTQAALWLFRTDSRHFPAFPGH